MCVPCSNETIHLRSSFSSQLGSLKCPPDLQMFNSNASEMPTDLPWQLLEEITNGFSEERKIGSGGYAVVYKGVYKNEEIAVKKLYHMPGLDDNQFQNELQNLTRLRHQNIVRLVGRSYEERDRCVEYKGKLVCAKMIDRVICLEYLHNGSLEKHLCDESSGLPWHRRYEIIKGICDGLRYLHGCQIFHLDLKPANILLDKNMVPKIADFGLSRLFSGSRQSHTTSKFLGTLGYVPPEYIEKGKISEKFDVFSLGVIITGIMTGPNGYSKHSEMSSQDFIEQVLGNWRNRLQEQWKDKSYLDVFCQQVKICIEIALNCVETDRHKRPSIGDIICKLNESETMIEKSYKIERKDQNVIKRKENWLQPSQLACHALALSKIGTTLGVEATKAVITKLSEKVTNLKELPAKVEEIKNELKTMNNVIQQIGTAYLTDEVVKGWIAEVRELAFHVEDVMDKYSYYAHKLEEEGFLMKFVKGSHYVTVFSGIADEIIQIERKVQNVIKRKENWLQPSQLSSNPLADIERHRSQDCFPELVKDEDLVGIEDNRRLLTKWLYTNEPGSTVITVSGMGGVGKTTLVRNVFDREKVNFPVNAWIVVSKTYTVDGLLRKLLQKIGYTEPPLSAKMDEMDVHDLKEEIKRQLKDTKCMVVLDDVWDREAYIQMRDALQNLQASRIIITTRNKHVAALAPPTRCLELKPLNSTDALELLWALLNNRDHVCPPELDELGKDTVDRCEGLPLAILSRI